MFHHALVNLRLIAGLFALISVLASPAFGQHASGNSSERRIEIPAARPEIASYNRIHYGLYFAASAWEFLGLGLLIRYGVGGLLRSRANRLGRYARAPRDSRRKRVRRVRMRNLLRSHFVRAGFVFSGISALMMLWRIPLQFTGYQIERAYGFATLGPLLWFSDRITSWVIGLVRIPAVWLGYLLLERAPKRWWLILWACSIPWTLTLTVLTPVVFDPAYNKFKPLQHAQLEGRLLDLAKKAGIPNAKVQVADFSRRTTKINAYVTGIGPTARMVIWDTTLAAISEDEIVAIIGHEIGHYVLDHVWWNFVAGVGASFLVLWALSQIYPWASARFARYGGIRSTHDLAALPVALFLLTQLIFIQVPVESAFSRYQERQADRYGLALTGMPESTARAFIAFVERNYTDPDPPRFIVLWFYSHPPIRERVESALSWRQPQK